MAKLNKVAFLRKEYWVEGYCDILKIKRYYILTFMVGIEMFSIGLLMLINPIYKNDTIVGGTVCLIGTGLILLFSHQFTVLNKKGK